MIYKFELFVTYHYKLNKYCIMQVSNITSQLKFINRIGATLSVEERISIQANAQKLACEYTFDQFNFWGRVEGISKNYYIIEGVTFKGATEFPICKFFWSNDDFKFAQLPEPRMDYKNWVVSCNDFFSGQHQKILIKNSDQPKIMRSSNGQQMVVKQKNFTQLDRLAIVVSWIKEDCNIVPLGAYRMIPTHELVLDPDFRGLKIHESKKLQNYLHLRPPKSSNKKILIQSEKSLQRSDFMDSIAQDQIKSCWSIQSDESGTEITIRSLRWPGYVGYHRTNSCIFGGAYMGNGILVHDLPFLL